MIGSKLLASPGVGAPAQVLGGSFVLPSARSKRVAGRTPSLPQHLGGVEAGEAWQTTTMSRLGILPGK